MDYAEALKRELWNHAQHPVVDQKFIGELVGRVNTMLELEALPFEAIQEFYKEEEQDATQTV